MKKHLVVLTVAFTVTISATAQAHTANLALTCGQATITWSDFTPASATAAGNGGLNTPNYSVTFTPAAGGVATTTAGTASFAGSGDTLTISLPPVDGSVYAASSWTAAQTTDGQSGSASTPSPEPVSGCPASTSTTTTTSTTTATTTTAVTTSTTTPPPAPSVKAITTASSAPPTTTTAAGGALPFQACQSAKLRLSKAHFSRRSGRFSAIVRGSGIKLVRFYVDGHRVKTLRRANSGKNGYAYTVAVSARRYGTHTVEARITPTCGKPTTKRLRFRRIEPARSVVPRFTG